MRTVCPHTAPQGVVPCSVKKYQLSDFCAQKASEAGFIPRINPREITEAGGTYGLLKLLKSEKNKFFFFHSFCSVVKFAVK